MELHPLITDHLRQLTEQLAAWDYEGFASSWVQGWVGTAPEKESYSDFEVWVCAHIDDVDTAYLGLLVDERAEAAVLRLLKVQEKNTFRFTEQGKVPCHPNAKDAYGEFLRVSYARRLRRLIAGGQK